MKKVSRGQSGTEFEQQVIDACETYEFTNRAFIHKLNTGTKFFKGKMVYVGSTPFDFMGSIKGPIPIGIECKAKQSATVETAKFKIVTDQETALAKINKKKTPVGIQSHQMHSLNDWIKHHDGLGMLFLKVTQNGRKVSPDIFYGIVMQSTLRKMHDQWAAGKRQFVYFNECDIIRKDIDFLDDVVACYNGMEIDGNFTQRNKVIQ